MEPKIPNFNTLSTLLDRLSIENVKLSHFQNALEHDAPAEAERAELQRKVGLQNDVIVALKKETSQWMAGVFLDGKYDYMKEERTFK